jgi:uncharacterized protein GlcG (DUF336 family)
MSRRLTGIVAALSLLTASCGGGGSGTSNAPGGGGGGNTPAAAYPSYAQDALTSAEVGRIVAQAVAEAQARALPSAIVVVDRMGNVLANFMMTGAPATAHIPDGPGGNFDAQGLDVPASAAAISKAVTAAFLSSAGNAFTTRTANFIVQEHFPIGPSTAGLESGPLFGVQFSQLPCSDLNARFIAGGGAGALIGPKRSPLGLAADAGAVPLYKNGVLVGGIGVMGDGVYGQDRNVLDIDQDDEEYVALAGSNGFEAPAEIRADRVTVDGTSLRFIDATANNLRSNPANAPAFAAINGSAGALVSVRGYYAEGVPPALLAGTAYGTEASGIRRATAAEFSDTDAFVLSNGSGAQRFSIRAGTDTGDVAQPLSASEVRTILGEAFTLMRRARAQIRRPVDSRAQMSISVVDTRGEVLGIVRGPDAPLFGIDVSLQKARTAAFFSGPRAAAELGASANGDVAGSVAAFRAFLGDATALTGTQAIADRWFGLLARPYFPDGQLGTANGPFSRPISQWSVFSTGTQSALIVGNLGQHVGFVNNLSPTDTPQRCTDLPDTPGGGKRLANGIQIFPGSVPIYRGNTLVGAIGVSGDGIDQDDMVAFLALENAAAKIGGIGNAPAAIRASQKSFPQAGGATLPYIQCPIAPFLDTSEQNVCRDR